MVVVMLIQIQTIDTRMQRKNLNKMIDCNQDINSCADKKEKDVCMGDEECFYLSVVLR